VMNVLQVLTSMQDSTLNTVPKLLASGLCCFLTLPWMLAELVSFTKGLWLDLARYVR
jgi:flagellar biosynthesis protein FliQ